MRLIVTIYMLFIFAAACTPPKWIVPRMKAQDRPVFDTTPGAKFDERFHFNVKPTITRGESDFA